MVCMGKFLDTLELTQHTSQIIRHQNEATRQLYKDSNSRVLSRWWTIQSTENNSNSNKKQKTENKDKNGKNNDKNDKTSTNKTKNKNKAKIKNNSSNGSTNSKNDDSTAAKARTPKKGSKTKKKSDEDSKRSAMSKDIGTGSLDASSTKSRQIGSKHRAQNIDLLEANRKVFIYFLFFGVFVLVFIHYLYLFVCLFVVS